MVTFLRSIYTVNGPIPPGTGVINLTLSRAFSNSTSPTILLLSTPSIPLLHPASIITDPYFSHLAFTRCLLPTPDIKISASLT